MTSLVVSLSSDVDVNADNAESLVKSKDLFGLSRGFFFDFILAPFSDPFSDPFKDPFSDPFNESDA
jgi:hypothetical protein